MGKKAKVIGAAAAAAAAATAAVVVTRQGGAKKIADKVSETMKAAKKKTAAAKSKLSSETVYHVKKSGDQWSVQADGAARASSLHPNKKAALDAARALASSKAPSKLVVHRVDGTVQDTHTYEPE